MAKTRCGVIGALQMLSGDYRSRFNLNVMATSSALWRVLGESRVCIKWLKNLAKLQLAGGLKDSGIRYSRLRGKNNKLETPSRMFGQKQK
jgi:hypothetical protein